MAASLINYLYNRFYLGGVAHYKQYVKLSKSSKEEYDKRLKHNLSKLLSHALNNVPYYSEILSDTKLSKNDKVIIENFEQFESIPVLTKDTIRNQVDRLYSQDYLSRNFYTNTSGGSTGEPLKVIQDKNFAQSAAGLFTFIKQVRTNNPYSDTVLLWGATRDFYGAKNTWKGHLADILNNTKKFNSAKLTREDILTFINHINRKKPSLIIAYVNSIYEVARFVEANNVFVTSQKAIHTGAGQLFDFMRETIERVFQCKVYNHYGGREMGAMATECNQFDGLHVLGDTVYLEVVDESGNPLPPGEEGDILVTTLTNYSMPLIRYKVEDKGIMKPYESCPCGIIYPKLARITGRTSNNFKLENGGMVSGEYLTLTFNHVKGIINFQIRQKAYNKLAIYLIVDHKYDKENTQSMVLNKMQKLFGENLVIDFSYVKDIPTTSTGKHLFTICEI